MAEDLNAIAMFIAVVEAKGFRAAALQLGVTGPAVSQAVRRLEEQVGVVLLQRTTRSVRLTEAGEGLYAAVRPALDEVHAAVAAVGEFAHQPRGTLRLNVASSADEFLSGPLLAGFLRRYPQVRVDLIVSAEATDIVAQGYDAAVRPGAVIEQDMMTVPVSDPIDIVVVGSPAYFAANPPPEHPRDLATHVCLNWRPGPDAPALRWEFRENGEDLAVVVNDRFVANDDKLLLRLALAGAGLCMGRVEMVRPYIERGELVAVLEAYARSYPAFYLYYPRRQGTPALRALIEYVLAERQSARRSHLIR
jgi:DNA-binding transcriptional LysR family regulator